MRQHFNTPEVSDPWVPGSLIRRVSDLTAIIPHSGIIGWPYPDGGLSVIHNCKGIGVIQTDTTGFANAGQNVEILRPWDADYQKAVLDRAHDGLHGGAGYPAAVQNCQDFANWAYYGIAFSETRDA